MTAVLNIKNLSKSFGKIQAVNDVSFEVPEGSVFGILGPNGSGKTTTLGILLDVVKADAGYYSWFGADAAKTPKKQIGAILETPNFYPYLTGYQNLKIVADIKDVAYGKINPVLEKVGLLGRSTSKFKDYSLGMKQRLAIGSALLSDPKVLVLDEPTNGLDPEGINEVRSIIKRIATEGKTIILASHLLDEVEKVCTHVGILKSGILMKYGSVNEILSDEIMLEVGAADLDALESALNSIDYIKIVERIDKQSHFLIQLRDDRITAADINKKLVNEGVAVNHILVKRKSLEDQFLQIVKGG